MSEAFGTLFPLLTDHTIIQTGHEILYQVKAIEAEKS
jgi:hypothetical protein